MDIFKLLGVIAISGAEDAKKQIGDTTDHAEKKSSSLMQTLGKIGTVAVSAVGAVSAAATAAYAGIANTAGAVASYGDNIDKMSQKMGMSAEAYQEWDAVMQHSGTSIESLQTGMKTLANAVESGNDAFNRLGITQDQIASMSNEELFSATITALQNVENETERTYLAGQLLGRGATELGALLNTSAEDTQAMKDRVHELGGVMSNEAVKAAARYQDSLQDMQTAFTGVKNNLFSQFLPGLATVMDGIGSLFAGESGAQETISKGLSEMIQKITDVIPQIFNVGKQIIGSLSTALINNLPMIFSSGMDIISMIISTLITNLPMIASTAFQLLLTLSEGISQSLPELIPTIVDVVLQIVETLIENIDLLIDAAVDLITALAEGLIAALPVLIAQAPTIIAKLMQELIAAAPRLLVAAADIILQLVTGIADNLFELGTSAGTIITTIVDGIGEMWDSIVDVGKQVVDKIKEGISKAWEGLKNWFNGIWDGLFGNRNVDVNVSGSTSSGGKTYDTSGFAKGLSSVPYNNFPALLHEGEAVLTASEAKAWRKGNGGAGNGVTIIQNISAPAQTPVQLASATAAYFEQARWAL